MNSAAVKYDGQNKYIRITDIDENSHQYIDSEPVSPDGNLEEKYIVKNNDILFARTGASVGKTYLYNPKDGLLYFAGFLIRANIKEPNNSYFIFNQTLTERYKKWVLNTSMRSGQPGINSQEYGEYNIYYPSVLEQNKIADFLSFVDQRIEKQRQLVESLKKYKRGLLSAIFERKIRFKDDNGNNYLVWSTYKLDDICLYKNGEAFEQQVNNSGMYKLISLNSLDIDGNLKPAEKFVNSANWYLEENDLIMVLSDVATGEFLGLCDVIPKNNEYVLNQRMGLLRLKTEDNIKYIRYFINANQKYFKKHGQGSSQKNLSKDDILNFEIKIPSINEQNKIVTIIESINKNILLNIEKISNLEKYKTGLLQQMFI